MNFTLEPSHFTKVVDILKNIMRCKLTRKLAMVDIHVTTNATFIFEYGSLYGKLTIPAKIYQQGSCGVHITELLSFVNKRSKEPLSITVTEDFIIVQGDNKLVLPAYDAIDVKETIHASNRTTLNNFFPSVINKCQPFIAVHERDLPEIKHLHVLRREKDKFRFTGLSSPMCGVYEATISNLGSVIQTEMYLPVEFLNLLSAYTPQTIEVSCVNDTLYISEAPTKTFQSLFNNTALTAIFTLNLTTTLSYPDVDVFLDRVNNPSLVVKLNKHQLVKAITSTAHDEDDCLHLEFSKDSLIIQHILIVNAILKGEMGSITVSKSKTLMILQNFQSTIITLHFRSLCEQIGVLGDNDPGYTVIYMPLLPNKEEVTI